MANEKILQTRIITKHADLATWESSNLELKVGEVVLAKLTTVLPDGGEQVNFIAKVGNGGTYNEAAWMYAKASDVYAWAKKENLDVNDIPEIPAEKVTGLTDKIAELDQLVKDFGAYQTIVGETYATKTELGNVDAKFANYKTSADQKLVDDEQDRRLGVIEADYLKAADIANFETKENVKKVSDALDTYKTENNAAVALKADKSVVDAMYTNTQIDDLIAQAKKYADDNDANTEYHVEYDSENKKIKLVAGADSSKMEIDASAFIKDGMISNVTIGEDNDLVITFNTDSGKEDIVLPLDQLVDIYTGVSGERVVVTVNSDKSISAELVAGSISKNYLDADVQASLGKADSALQSHQDISHLASTEYVNGEFAKYTTTTEMNGKFEQVTEDIGTALETAKGYADGKDTAIAAAKAAGDNAQSAVDTLAGYVGTFTASEGVDTVVDYIDAKTANIASDERVSGIDDRLATVEEDYLKLADKTELNGLITGLDTRMGTAEGKITDLETASAKHISVGTDNKMYLGADVIVFDCGGAE